MSLHNATAHNVKLCLEFADKILTFAVLKRWLLQLSETDSSFVLQYFRFYLTK